MGHAVKPVCRFCRKEFDGRHQAKFCTAACAFWAGIDQEDFNGNGCWLWRKRVDLKGYARLRFCRVDYPAHRMSWALAHDVDVFESIYSMCGNKACVRPDHWSLDKAWQYG